MDNLMDMFSEAQKEIEDTTKRLDNIIVKEELQGGEISISATGNKKITDISISEELFRNGEKDEIEDLLISAINKILAKAEEVNIKEMEKTAGGMLSGFSGLL